MLHGVNSEGFSQKWKIKCIWVTLNGIRNEIKKQNECILSVWNENVSEFALAAGNEQEQANWTAAQGNL